MKEDRIIKAVEKLSGGNYKKLGRELRCRCPKWTDKDKHPKGDASPSFFVNLNSGNFQCFACGYKGGYKKLISISGENYYPEVDEIQAAIVKYKTKSSTDKKILKDVPLPPLLSKTWLIHNGKIRVINPYLLERNVKSGKLMKELNVQVCKAEGFLNNAIIYPIKYKDMSFWGARITNGQFSGETPYFYPHGSPKELVLYDFVKWKNDYDTVILVEGWFDFVRLRLYGYRNVIPLFGKFISTEQIKDLLDANIRKLFIYLDNDAYKDALNLGRKTMRFFEVYIVNSSQKDPDVTSEEETTKVIDSATNIMNL